MEKFLIRKKNGPPLDMEGLIERQTGLAKSLQTDLSSSGNRGGFFLKDFIRVLVLVFGVLGFTLLLKRKFGNKNL
jgi:hypothetical protein